MAIFRYDEDEDLVDDFKEHYEIMIDNVKELIRSLRIGDIVDKVSVFDELFRIFHNLKSSSMYFHLHEMSELCHKAEDIIVDIKKLEYNDIDAHIRLLVMIYRQFHSWLENILNNDEALVDVEKSLKCYLTYF